MSDLKNISNVELVSRIEKLVRTERKITHLILNHINEIEARKIFAELGFDSMYSYLTQGLGYSEASAYRRIQSARLLKQTPEVSEKLENGSLNLSQLTQVQKCVKESRNAGHIISAKATLDILEKLENKNTFETEKVLAVEFDRPVQSTESIKPQQDDSVRLQITLSKEQFEELTQAKSLLSHICHDGNWADVITTLAKTYNKQKLKGRAEQTEMSERARSSTQRFAAARAKVSTPGKRPRKYISVHLKRSLMEKANNCCEYVNPTTQRKCQSNYKLQVDHIQPWSLDGSNASENLRVLCQTHNNFRNFSG